VEKVSSTGALMATDPGNSGFNEMWRIESSICPPGFVVFGNGTCCPDQATMLDTTMATINPVNIIGPACTTGYHDMALTAVDPFGGFAWTETTHSLVYTTWNNCLIKSPIPALSPSVYNVPIHYSFYEISSIFYDPNLVFNAMNGLVSGRAWMFAYNGDTLKQINKNTGAITAQAQISATPFTCGGLDVDLCDNVYLANGATIQEYDGNTLAQTATLPAMPGTNYDLALGTYTSNLLYACGQNYVSEISLGPPQTIPLVITQVPTTCALCSGSATVAAMPCGVIDTLNVTYLWSDGETTRTASHLCSGLDSVGVTVECGLTYYDTVTINSQSGGYTVTRDSASATCVNPGSASVTLAGGAPPYTYHWSNGSTTSTTGPVGAGSYCVAIRDNSGCYDSLCITVGGTTLPTVTASPVPDSICSGSSTTLTATVTGGVAPYTYNWSSGSTLSTATVSPTLTTTYSVTGTDANGCSNSATIVVDVVPAPPVSITAPNDSICTGGSVTLTASGAGLTYTWAPSITSTTAAISVSPTVTTTYTVIGKNANNCTGTASFTVYVSDGPAITVSPNVSICGGKTVTLTATSTGGVTYLWAPGGSTNQTITVSPTATTTYVVSGTNKCGTVSANVTVTVLPTPVPSFTADPPAQCAPACVAFKNFSTVSSGAISEYAWTFGNGDSALTKTPTYCYPKPGQYDVTLTVTSDSGCSATLQVIKAITVYSNPNASFTATPQPTTIIQPTIQFTDQSTDAYGIVFWSWAFGGTGDSTASSMQNPSHTYSDTGTYCVQLSVVNQHGCVDTTTNCVVISPIFALYIPSAFSPNGDGKNEVFMAKGNDVKTFEMYIFDRWGMQLFHSSDINVGWDGTVKSSGSICQEDTYVYMIKATDNKNVEHSYTGSVNLIK
jgi:gliding motility-associated-like protein